MTPGERVVHVGKVHWTAFQTPIFLACCFVAIVIVSVIVSPAENTVPVFACIAISLFGLMAFSSAYAFYRETEYVITTRRLVCKLGGRRLEAHDLLLPKIDSVSISGTAVYGDLRVAVATEAVTLRCLAQPIEFKKTLERQIELSTASK